MSADYRAIPESPFNFEQNPSQAERDAYNMGIQQGQAASSLLLGSLLAEAHNAAYTSEVTGLPNKRSLEERLFALQAAGKLGNYVLLFGDGNNFKAINETHGHDVGDDVLRETGYALVRGLRTIYNPNGIGKDEVFHISGDEFVALLYKDEDTTEEDIDATRRRISAEMNGVLERDPRLQVLGYGLGMGIAHLKPDSTIKSLKAEAEIEMKKAKRIQKEKDGTWNRETGRLEHAATATTTDKDTVSSYERRRALLKKTYGPDEDPPSTLDVHL
jgi:diguanylate cyclase (GGDEF)-like protein